MVCFIYKSIPESVVRNFGNMYKDLYCSVALIGKNGQGGAVNRRMFPLSMVLCHHNDKLVGKDTAGAGDDPLMSPEPASLFLEADCLPPRFSKSSELPEARQE